MLPMRSQNTGDFPSSRLSGFDPLQRNRIIIANFSLRIPP
jgi:hypothetical protein